MSASIFPTTQLPRGPHSLSREQVAESQRLRLMAAFTELLAERGFAAVTVGELAARAGVSRAAFYECFADKQACLFAAYERFAAALVEAMTAEIDADTPWAEFVEITLRGYLTKLESEPVAARAFIVEMDSAGPAARRHRGQAIHGFAGLIAERHAAIRKLQPSLGPLPERAYVALALGIRGLVQEALETNAEPRLTELAPDIVVWVTAAVEGAQPAASAR